MKTLKITLLLLGVVLLTVSGTSSDTVNNEDEITYKEKSTYDLLAHAKKKRRVTDQ